MECRLVVFASKYHRTATAEDLVVTSVVEHLRFDWDTQTQFSKLLGVSKWRFDVGCAKRSLDGNGVWFAKPVTQ